MQSGSCNTLDVRVTTRKVSGLYFSSCLTFNEQLGSSISTMFFYTFKKYHQSYNVFMNRHTAQWGVLMMQVDKIRFSHYLGRPRILVAECLFSGDPYEFYRKNPKCRLITTVKEVICAVGLKDFQRLHQFPVSSKARVCWTHVTGLPR